MALLGLSKTYGEQRLEQVCTQLVKEGISPSFTNVKNMLAAMSATSEPPASSPPLIKPRGFLRDTSYFEQAVEREGKHDQK
jgi:copper homeostasis protein CutC